MRFWKWVTSFLLVLIFVGLPKLVFAFDVPDQPTGYVNDYAQVLSAPVSTNLEQKIASLSAQPNGAEIAVVTLPSLEGESIEGVSQQFFDTWKIGKATSDNGILLLVAIEDHKVRIQTGYGVESVITDSTAGRIIRQDITPLFKENNYDQGISNGVNKLITYVQNPDSIPTETATNSNFWVGFFFAAIWFLIALFTYLAAFLGRSKSWWAGGLMGAILGFFVASLAGVFFFGFLGLVIDYILSKNYSKWKLNKRPTGWAATWGGFKSSGSSHSSGGFSGFSGGSSGGGGASGSW